MKKAQIITVIMLIGGWLHTMAQQELRPDTISVRSDATNQLPMLDLDRPQLDVNSGAQFQLDDGYALPEALPGVVADSVAPFTLTPQQFAPGSVDLWQWRSGGITASGQTEVMPGLMKTDQGALTLQRWFGSVEFSVFGSATKYGYYRGLSTQWGVGGSLTYLINDNLSFTAFGSYYSPTSLTQPAMLGYVNTSTYGGYFNYRFGDSRFGVKVGAQRYYCGPSGAGSWETQPIVMPYYQLRKGVEFGVDLGGILYQVLRNSDHFGGASGNPTIAPPKNPGPVLPRR